MIAVAVIAAHAGSLDGVFLFDDRNSVETNPSIHRLSSLADVLRPPQNTPVAGRPVVNLTFAINYAIGGLDVTSYHVFNIAIHLANALLLFGFVRRTLELEPLGQTFGRASDGLAAATALLWAVHPLVTEPVAYTTQRTESLMATFYLLTMYAAARARTTGTPGPWVVTAAVASALGMASKESMVTVPLMLVLYDWAFRSEPFGELVKRRWPLYAAVASTWVVLALLALSGPRSATAGFAAGISPGTYLLNQPGMILRYFRLTIWPSPLLVDYGFPQPLTIGEVLPQLAVVTGLVAATAFALIRYPPLGFAGAWVFVILSPSSSIVPIASEVGAERRIYLPLAAIVAVAVLAGFRLLARLRDRDEPDAGRGSLEHAPLVAVTCIAIVLSIVTAKRHAQYQSEEDIWRSVIENRPQWRAHSHLGSVLSRTGRAAEALPHHRLALEGDPDSIEMHYNIANDSERLGDLDTAIRHYGEFLKRRPQDAVVQNLLGVALLSRERGDEAIERFREAIRIDPAMAEAHANLGNELMNREQYAEAEAHFRRFIELDPDNAEIENNLGLALVSQDRLADAVPHFRKAVQLRPDVPDPHFNLGLALVNDF
ncbi:MAG: tetratricopeptide repeat protein, partial [Vicinamibacterales bacterium]